MSLKKSNKHGQTPLHQAAMYGQLSKCKEIIDIVENKNPKDKEGMTQLHLAAEYWISRLPNRRKLDYFDICQLIIDNTDDKNPKDDRDETPLHLAAGAGQFFICQFSKYEKIRKWNGISFMSITCFPIDTRTGKNSSSNWIPASFTKRPFTFVRLLP